MVRVPIHAVPIHALDGLMQQKYLLCSAALPSHPILPCQLNSNVEMATFSGQGAVPGNESWFFPAPHSSTLPSPDPSESGLHTGMLFWAGRWSLLGAFDLNILPPHQKKERYRALTPLSSKSALELPVSELLFMWHYKALLPKCHLIYYTITCSQSTLIYTP